MIFVHSKISDGNMTDSQNRKIFLKKLKIKNIAEVKQVHGKKIILIKEIIDPQIADGLITNNKNICLMIKTADCIPIAFYDPENHAIGLIHAGAMGLEKEIIKAAILQIKKHFGTNPANLIIKFGPSIGPCCYKKDIWQIAQDQLIQNGILEKNIDNPKICTYENKKYFSHRRACDEKSNDGRFVTILGL